MKLLHCHAQFFFKFWSLILVHCRVDLYTNKMTLCWFSDNSILHDPLSKQKALLKDPFYMLVL